MPAPAAFLAYGKVSSPDAALAGEGAEVAARGGGLGRQVALIAPETDAFRLNSPGAFRVTPELVAALPDRAGLRLLCRDRIEATLPTFAARGRRWIRDYLDLLERAFPLGDDTGTELTDRSDRYFVALLPMTAARIVPVEIDAGNAVRMKGSEFASLDLAFWTGQRIVGVLFGAENTTTPAEDKALSSLADRLGQRLQLRRIVAPADGVALAEDLVEEARAAPGPWFGPYRAEALGADLP